MYCSFLGFDPCAESFKGLADLIEKENGMQQHYHLSLHQQNRLGSPPQNSYPPHPMPQSPHQNNTLLRSLPPGFSISQIQQQQQQLQQQQFFRHGELGQMLKYKYNYTYFKS